MTLRPLLARSLDEALALIEVIADIYMMDNAPLSSALVEKMKNWSFTVNTTEVSSEYGRNLVVDLKPTSGGGLFSGSRLVLKKGPISLYAHFEHLAWHMAVITDPSLLNVNSSKFPSEKSEMAKNIIDHYCIKPEQILQSYSNGNDIHTGKATIRFTSRFGELSVAQFIVESLIISNESHYQIGTELPFSAVDGLQRYVGQSISKIVDLEILQEKSRIIHITGQSGLVRAIVKTNALEADMMLGTSLCQGTIVQKIRKHREGLITRNRL